MRLSHIVCRLTKGTHDYSCLPNRKRISRSSQCIACEPITTVSSQTTGVRNSLEECYGRGVNFAGGCRNPEFANPAVFQRDVGMKSLLFKLLRRACPEAHQRVRLREMMSRVAEVLECARTAEVAHTEADSRQLLAYFVPTWWSRWDFSRSSIPTKPRSLADIRVVKTSTAPKLESFDSAIDRRRGSEQQSRFLRSELPLVLLWPSTGRG